jgi:hypothetical protein
LDDRRPRRLGSVATTASLFGAEEDNPEHWLPLIEQALSENTAEIHPIGVNTISILEPLKAYQLLPEAGERRIRL